MKKEWDVDWCESVPTDEVGDADLDRAVNKCRRFPTHDKAVEFAKQAAAGSYWGVAQVRAVAEVRRADIESDDDLQWWLERGHIMAYVSECEEVVA